MSRKAPPPKMLRATGDQPHPLLVDRVVYVQAGADDAETQQRIAEACAAADVKLERAVACIQPKLPTK